MAHLKYGFLRVLKQRIDALKDDNNSWVHVNDVRDLLAQRFQMEIFIE